MTCFTISTDVAGHYVLSGDIGLVMPTGSICRVNRAAFVGLAGSSCRTIPGALIGHFATDGAVCPNGWRMMC